MSCRDMDALYGSPEAHKNGTFGRLANIRKLMGIVQPPVRDRISLRTFLSIELSRKLTIPALAISAAKRGAFQSVECSAQRGSKSFKILRSSCRDFSSLPPLARAALVSFSNCLKTGLSRARSPTWKAAESALDRSTKPLRIIGPSTPGLALSSGRTSCETSVAHKTNASCVSMILIKDFAELSSSSALSSKIRLSSSSALGRSALSFAIFRSCLVKSSRPLRTREFNERGGDRGAIGLSPFLPKRRHVALGRVCDQFDQRGQLVIGDLLFLVIIVDVIVAFDALDDVA